MTCGRAYLVPVLVDLVAQCVLGGAGAGAERSVGVLGDLLVGLLGGAGDGLVDLVRGKVGGVLDGIHFCS